MLFLVAMASILPIVLSTSAVTSKSSGWLKPSVDHYNATNVDPDSPDLHAYSPSSYVDLKLSWSRAKKMNVNFVVLTFLYSSDGNYIGRAALYYRVLKGVLKRHSLRLFTRRSRCYDDTSLASLGDVADKLSWAMLGEDEPFAMINGDIPADDFTSKAGRSCSGSWKSVMRNGKVSRVRVAVHNFDKRDLGQSVAIEWKIRPQSDKITEWTSIFNSTTKRYDVGNFHLKFTQHKEVDKFLYISPSVFLYDSNGTELGKTNFIFYMQPNEEKTEFSGYKRFYLTRDGLDGQCSRKIKLPYLADANFEMITDVRSEEMYLFRVSGVKYKEKMGDCSNYGDWQQVVDQASSMEMKLTTWVKDLSDYFTTEYKVAI